MNLTLAILVIGQLQVTSYRSVPSQTDDSPFITSIGERVNEHGVAVSQDLLKKNGGPLNYGDMVYIENLGWKVVNDCMHPRYRNRIDVWVKDYKSEKAFDERFKRTKLLVYVVRNKRGPK